MRSDEEVLALCKRALAAGQTWIVINRGDHFEGTLEQFEDCFGGVGILGLEECVRRSAGFNDYEIISGGDS